MLGRKFGALTVVDGPCRQGVSRALYWRCVCECGNESLVRTARLTSGEKLSCGCVSYANLSKSKTRHGFFGTATYQAWSAMHTRCKNENCASYPRYGGRGIKVCARWGAFENFLADMGVRPDGMSLDRHPDQNGDYEPGNCRWATRLQQARNRERTVMVSFRGRTLAATEWAELLGFPRWTVTCRLKQGWSVERALTEPNGLRSPEKRYCRPISFGGVTLPMSVWESKLGLGKGVVRDRLERGLPIEEVLSTKKSRKQ